MTSGPIDYSYENIGRVPEHAALPSSIVLYAIAIIAATLRAFTRWHYGQLRLVDDGMVLFSVLCMTVAFGLWISYLNDIYVSEALIYAPFQYLGQIPDVVQVAINIQIFSTTYNILCITGIFAIKFSFLFFFRHLIDRIRKLQIYWLVVTIYTAIVWVISLSIVAIACPFYDARAVQCGQGTYFRRAYDISVVLIVFDCTTDALIISIPIILIRRIKIDLRSKLYLALSLCLSFVMIVVAILQAATITRAGIDAIDVVWELYFQFIELTIAILVVSLTAFRTFFIGHNAKNSRPSTETPPKNKWYSNGPKKVWKKMSTSGTSASDGTLWSQDERSSSRPLPATIQTTGHRDSEVGRWSDRILSGARKLSSSRRLSDRQSPAGRGLSDRQSPIGGPPVTYGGDTLISQSDPEPFIGGTLSGPLMDMPMATPLPSPPEENDPLDTDAAPRLRRPRSDISAERRISYWQRMIQTGMQRAAAIMPGRSPTPSPAGRNTPPAATGGVSPISHSPDRSHKEQV